jgi:hypothetical protein
VAGLLKIRGSEIQQRYSELMMLAAGPFSLPFVREAMEAGWQGDHVGARALRTAGRRPTSTCARPPSTVAPTKCSATSSPRPC